MLWYYCTEQNREINGVCMYGVVGRRLTTHRIHSLVVEQYPVDRRKMSLDSTADPV